MTWIAYKRGSDFYAKQRGNPASEVKLDHGTWCDVKATGELDNKIVSKLQKVQSTEIVSDGKSKRSRRNKVDSE